MVGYLHMGWLDRFRRKPVDRADGYVPIDPPPGDPWKRPELVQEMEARVRSGHMDAIDFDGFVNQLTGIGDWTQDKTLGGQRGGPDFFVDLLPGIACENRWRGSDLGGRIVETIPDEMTREGWKLQVQPSDDDDEERSDEDAPIRPPMALPEIDDEGADVSQAVMDDCDEIMFDDRITEALQYEKAYGGSGILIGADDGQDLTQPLDEERIQSIDWVNTFRGGWDGEIVAWSYYRDPSAPNYGMPEMYMLRNIGVPIARVPAPGERINERSLMLPMGSTGYGNLITWVHASRFLIFPGQAVSRRARVQMRGWGDSVFTRVDRVLMHYDQTWDGIANLMTDFSQGILKVDGLAQALAAKGVNGGSNATATLATKARTLQVSRSIARLMIVDAKEDFKRDTASLAGLPEMLQQFALRLAAAADMPVSLLMGQAPAGLNATGDADIRFFYDRVKSRQNRRLTPQIRRFVQLLMKAKRGPTNGKEIGRVSIIHNPLYQMSALEQADLRLKTNQADALEIQNGVLAPEEVAASEWGGSEWSSNRVIDFKGRERMAKQAAKEQAAKKKAQEKIMSEAAKAGVAPAQLALNHPEHPANAPRPGEAEEDKVPE